MPAARQARMVGCQVASDNVRTGTGHSTGYSRTGWAKILNASQVRVRIDDSGVLVEVRVAGILVFHGGVGGVAAIAISLPVHDKASQAHQITVLPLQIQLDRRDLQTDFN